MSTIAEHSVSESTRESLEHCQRASERALRIAAPEAQWRPVIVQGTITLRPLRERWFTRERAEEIARGWQAGTPNGYVAVEGRLRSGQVRFTSVSVASR